MRGALAILVAFSITENVISSRDATQSYTLVLPRDYSTDRKWPVLLVLDPRGRGTVAAGLFREAAEERGWILLSSNNTRSDTSWDVNTRALDAMLGELPKYAVDPHRIYAAGFSGTASVAWMLVTSKQFAGVINAGQPYQDGLDGAHASFAVWSAAGLHDFNNLHVRHIDADVAQSGRPHQVEIFDGSHEWMPPALARAAIEWHDLQAMRADLRERDTAFVGRLYESEMDRAAKSKDELAALRRYESIARNFEGLRDTSESIRAAAALRQSPRVRALLRDAERADAYEKRELDAVLSRLRAVLGEETPPASAVRALRIGHIERDASESSYHGAASRRILETLFTQSAFYLPQRFFASHEYDKAAIALAIATALKPDRANLQYDFARALARSGRKDDAITALERAIRLGLTRRDPRMEGDFESLRAMPRFAEVLRGMR